MGMTGNPTRSVGRRIDRLSHLRQRTRRLIVAATLVGLPAAYLWSSYWLTTSTPTILWGPVTFLLFGATLVGAFLLYGFVRRRADLPGVGLDERERQLRDRAWILAYQVLSAVVVGAIVVAGLEVFVFGNEITLDADAVNGLVLSVAVLL